MKKRSIRRSHTVSQSSKRGTRMQRMFIWIFVGLLAIYGFILFFRSIAQSAFMDSRDRIHLVVYGPNAYIVSFGISDDVHYLMSMSHNDKIDVPGGYGRYPVGSLGRLSQIEKDNDLVQRSFSSMISAYADYYVIPKNADVYETKDDIEPDYSDMAIIRTLFSGDYITNASFFDKLYLAYMLASTRKQDFIPLKGISERDANGEQVFSENRFLKKNKGLFYHVTLREEALNVKLQYISYKSALTLARIIEGQGIRVVDYEALSESTQGDSARNDTPSQERCILKYDEDRIEQTKTLAYLKNRFSCDVVKADTEAADILLVIGEGLTEEWK